VGALGDLIVIFQELLRDITCLAEKRGTLQLMSETVTSVTVILPYTFTRSSRHLEDSATNPAAGGPQAPGTH